MTGFAGRAGLHNHDFIASARMPAPPDRNNVTALIPHYNEPFVRESVLSIAPCVKEVLVADNGSSVHYLSELERTAAEAGNVRVFHLDLHEQPRLAEMREFLNGQCRTEWCLLFDADCIAYEEDDPRSLVRLFAEVAGDSVTGIYGFRYPYVSGDLDHHETGKEFHEDRLVLYRRGALHYRVGLWIDEAVPAAAGNIRWLPSHPWVAVNLKPIERMAYRGMMDLFVTQNSDPERLKTLWDWFYHRQTGRFPDNDNEVRRIKEMNMEWFRKQVRSFERFDFEKWGPHPRRLLASGTPARFRLTPVEGGHTLEAYPLHCD